MYRTYQQDAPAVRPEGVNAEYLIVDLGSFAAAEVSCDLCFVPYERTEAAQELVASEQAADERPSRPVVLIFRVRGDAEQPRGGGGGGGGRGGGQRRDERGSDEAGRQQQQQQQQEREQRVVGYAIALGGPQPRRNLGAWTEVPSVLRGDELVRAGWVRVGSLLIKDIPKPPQGDDGSGAAAANDDAEAAGQALRASVANAQTWTRLAREVGAHVCNSIDTANRVFVHEALRGRTALLRGSPAPGAVAAGRGSRGRSFVMTPAAHTAATVLAVSRGRAFAPGGATAAAAAADASTPRGGGGGAIAPHLLFQQHHQHYTFQAAAAYSGFGGYQRNHHHHHHSHHHLGHHHYQQNFYYQQQYYQPLHHHHYPHRLHHHGQQHHGLQQHHHHRHHHHYAHQHHRHHHHHGGAHAQHQQQQTQMHHHQQAQSQLQQLQNFYTTQQPAPLSDLAAAAASLAQALSGGGDDGADGGGEQAGGTDGN